MFRAVAVARRVSVVAKPVCISSLSDGLYSTRKPLDWMRPGIVLTDALTTAQNLPTPPPSSKCRETNPHQTQTRSFSAAAFVRRDLVQDMYLNEIRNYKAPKAAAADSANLVSSFAQPKAPAAPALESEVAAFEDGAAIAEAEWPALKSPIDDHHNYNDEWDFITDANDGGVLLPKRLKPVDYSGEHH
ncbi:hypothetical protein BCR33DRAFT_780129 [Rhizoclosmatium globosum]|uniref:Uncharacterized protein n=1 Tax=Rhizoclosmatium globosum TaxID=329046 RepID=A0A1Y2CYE0_9FUNG|nr:hypothetical protein BCR33DRAFT_780129 [Rhizoclosmatium globosum]|eukprot:ORY51977.1 hypothetical protein BCR33DRAFT_780129 [Rhizoclosmatium globosum]